jgi:hypothetical protein
MLSQVPTLVQARLGAPRTRWMRESWRLLVGRRWLGPTRPGDALAVIATEREPGWSAA